MAKTNDRIITVDFRGAPRVFGKEMKEADKLLPHQLWEAQYRVVATYTRDYCIDISGVRESGSGQGYEAVGAIVDSYVLVRRSDFRDYMHSDIMEYLLTQEKFRPIRESLEAIEARRTPL